MDTARHPKKIALSCETPYLLEILRSHGFDVPKFRTSTAQRQFPSRGQNTNVYSPEYLEAAAKSLKLRFDAEIQRGFALYYPKF